MDDIRLGARVRLVRHRLGWRQVDVAARARVSQDTVSRVERGRIGALQVETVRRVLRALDVDLRLEARWRGGDLDRLADEGHAALVGRVATILTERGWIVRPEVSFNVYGERGSIDILAWHPSARILLVVEVKTSLNSVEETVRRHDVKVRLAAGVASERFGWAPLRVASLLVLPDDSTARRRVAGVDTVLRRRYELRGRTARSWLAAPAGSQSLLLFVPLTPGERGIRSVVARRRIRRRRTAPAPSTDAPAA